MYAQKYLHISLALHIYTKHLPKSNLYVGCGCSLTMSNGAKSDATIFRNEPSEIPYSGKRRFKNNGSLLDAAQ